MSLTRLEERSDVKERCEWGRRKEGKVEKMNEQKKNETEEENAKSWKGSACEK